MVGASARPAEFGDAAAISELVADCAAELRPHRGGEMLLATEGRSAPHEPQILAEIDDPAVQVLCGLYDGVIVGYAVTVLRRALGGASYAVITDLFTLPDARHVGVGEELLGAILLWARQHGATSIDAHVLPGARDSKNFFETFGLTARALIVNRKL